MLERRAIPEEAEEDGKLSKFIVELGRYQVMDRKESLDAVQIREEATVVRRGEAAFAPQKVD